MIQRRARAAGIRTRLGNHTFRATGITAYLKNGGTLEKAAMIANHASTRTTQLYDRHNDEVSQGTAVSRSVRLRPLWDMHKAPIWDVHKDTS
jgi:integrase